MPTAVRLFSKAVPAALLLLLLVTAPASADAGHTHVGTVDIPLPPAVVWVLLAAIGTFLLYMVWRQGLLGRFQARSGANGRLDTSQADLARTGGGGGALQGIRNYVATVRKFSRNARYFLAYALLSGLGTGIWNVMFNLYLLRLGFDIRFIGLYWLSNMLGHGLMAFPAGLIADMLGRRRTFFIATVISAVARGVLLFTLEPWALLALAALSGVGESFHGVTGGPFIMENSEPEERPHLFSINSSLLSISTFVGSISGGLLPIMWATVMEVPAVDPLAARLALVIALPLTIVALAPLAFIHEKPVELVERITDLLMLKNIVHGRAIAKLFILNLLLGIAFGITVRFFNIFFADHLNASDGQVGLILAIGALGGAVTVLATPMLAARWGKVRTLTLSLACSVPFLMLMTAVPGATLVTLFFLIRGSIYGFSLPLGNQISMELVVSKERGTTAGATHAAFDLGGGVGALTAGGIVAASGFAAAFAVASALILVPAMLYYIYFGYLDRQTQPIAEPQPILTR